MADLGHNDHVPTYRDSGVVLRTHPLGEADRIITILTREHGRIRAVGRGVRRTASRFGARLEPMGLVDLQLLEGRSLDVVTQVDSLFSFGADLAADYPRWTAAQAMCEAAERFTPEERDPAPAQLSLLVGGLRALAQRRHASGLILDAYLLRGLAVSGWAASFDECARCGATGPHRAFSLAGGGALCAECRIPGSATPRADTMVLLGALLSGDWETAGASAQRDRREASGLVTAYLQWHLERQLRALPLVERT